MGVGFASETLLITVITPCAFALYYPFVIKSEEAELQRLHKDTFTPYFEHVPRFFPSISKLKEPEEYLVKPVIFKRHLFDALWFIWVVGILEIIEELHELDILPTLFTMY